MKLTVINDTHLGVSRQTGTTPESQKALTEFMKQQFLDLLNRANNSDLLINGDLFDKSDVDKSIEFFVFRHLQNWCVNNPNKTLFLAAGNHDESKSSDVISSFHNLASYLEASISNVKIISKKYEEIYPGIFVIPHMMNQDLFSQELAEVLKQSPKYVFLHANYDNKFAAQTDHSLNVSADLALEFAKAGTTLVFAHEHKKRQIGNVHIVGNQIISSIADCLGDDTKQYVVLDDTGLQYVTYQQIADCFAEIDWTASEIPEKHFLRISGEADQSEAAATISTLKNIRQKSEAFVVTNSIRIKSLSNEKLAEVDDVKKYDVKELVARRLSESLKHRFEEVVALKEGN